MFGWMLIFALIVLVRTVLAVSVGVVSTSGLALVVVFTFLLALSGLTLLLRRRA
jgi:hypothetical protein